MRILLFSGKGGVGKTSLAAATGVKLAQQGYKTLVMSVDPAHSLGDAFDIGTDLFTRRTADPLTLRENLDIQEINIQKEIKRHWNEISTYIVSVLRTSGISGVEADELAILPGMEELSAMMYVNQYVRNKRYDVIVLDCAPTAESLRFVSMPTMLSWYMKHVFPLERKVLKAVRPLANKISPVELPSDSYFGNVLELFEKIEGIEQLLEDPKRTSVRLVTNPEKMVLRETQRAYVYFSLHGLTVDRIFVNRVLPAEIQDPFFAAWRKTQAATLEEIETYFDPVKVSRVPLFQHEVLGMERLEHLAGILYPEGEDPIAVGRDERPYTFEKSGTQSRVVMKMPFALKGEVGLFKKGDELVVQIGTLRRHIGLPTSMASLAPSKAKLENNILTIDMNEVA
jgi:arsenite/tail-anchored protein-transporting ATPase